MLVSRTSGVTAVGTIKYALFRAVLDTRFTDLDPNDPNGDHVCQGCLDQACLVLEEAIRSDTPLTG